MKKIIMICWFITASGLLYAQNAQGPGTLSQAEFGKQVELLNTAIQMNKTDDAQARWKEVHTMMMTELSITKFKIKDAVEAKNDADRDKYIKVLVDQRNAYTQALKASENMTGNKAALNKELAGFQSLIF